MKTLPIPYISPEAKQAKTAFLKKLAEVAIKPETARNISLDFAIQEKNKFQRYAASRFETQIKFNERIGKSTTDAVLFAAKMGMDRIESWSSCNVDM